MQDNWIKGRLSISEVFKAIDDVVACESCDPVCRLCLRDRKKLKGMVKLLTKQQTFQVEKDAIEKTNKRWRERLTKITGGNKIIE